MNEHQDFIEDNVIIFSKQTIELLMKCDNFPDILAVYTFYYYTAKWQKTNQPKAVVGYVAQGIGLSEQKVREAKRNLIKMGLITEVTAKNSQGKIIGWYIKLNYIWKIETHTHGNPQGGFTHTVENLQTNALSDNNINALNNNNNKKKKSKKVRIIPERNKLFLSKYNEIFGTHLKSDEGWYENAEHWLTIYSEEEVLRAICSIKSDAFWKDKMDLSILFRRRNPQGEAVDYIGKMLNNCTMAANKPRTFMIGGELNLK